jgi:O-antigen/teichoic acid export membrane protein
MIRPTRQGGGPVPRSVTTRVVTGMGWIVAWRMFSRMLGFISILVLAGLLKPGDFGIAAMATAISGAIDGLSSLGVRDALVRLRDDDRRYYDTAFTFQVARGVVTGLVIAGMSLFASQIFGEPRLRPILLILGALVAIGSFENIGMVKYSRALDFRVQFILQAAPRLIGFVVVVGLALRLHSYWALIAGAAVAKIVGVASTYVLSPHRPRFGREGWRYLLHFSFWTWAAGLANVVLNRADPFILSPVLGPASFGLYVLAAEIGMLPVTELLEPACTALFPGLAMAHRSGTQPVEMGLTVAGALALCTIPAAAGISASSGYLTMGLLGPAWQSAQPLIAILAWGCAFLPFSWVAVTVLSAQGSVRRVFAGQAVAAVLKVVGLLAVRMTHDLRLICFAATAIVAVESMMFIAQLRMAGNREMRALLGTLVRAALSAACTSLVLLLVPGTWCVVEGTRIAATLEGGLIGLLTFALFFSCQGAVWWLTGRAPGAEARLWSLLSIDKRVNVLVDACRLRRSAG